MSEAGWTSEKPTRAGWYWIRAPKHGWRDCVLWVDQDDDGFYIDVGDCDTEYVTDIDAEWLGPITPDSYQQGRVAGLGDVKRYVERQIKIGEDFIGGPDPNIQRRVALDGVIEYCDRQLAQQAQEGGVGG